MERDNGVSLITKGAFQHVLDACATLADGTALDAHERARLEQRSIDWSSRGIRALAVASRTLRPQTTYGSSDEHDLVFAGFVTFLDNPKEGAAQALSDLAGLGVSVKLITGDSKLIAAFRTPARVRANTGIAHRDAGSNHTLLCRGSGGDEALVLSAAPLMQSRRDAVGQQAFGYEFAKCGVGQLFIFLATDGRGEALHDVPAVLIRIRVR